MEKKLKISLLILVIALISIISFAGIYTKDGLFYKGKLPEYLLDSDLEGKRITYLKPTEETEEVIYDKDGNKLEEIPEDANEDDYRKETVKLNSDESLNKENYKVVKKVFEDRLKGNNIYEYVLRLNEDAGEIVLQLPDNEYANTALQYLLFKGNFEIVDQENNANILNRKDVVKSSVSYESSKTGEVTVYLDIELTSEGAKKLEEYSKNHINEENETEDLKMADVMIEDVTIAEINLDETIKDKILKVSLGSGTDNSTVNAYLNQGGLIAYIINCGEVPVIYDITLSEVIDSEFGANALRIIIICLCVLTIIALIYIIFKFKLDGLYAGLSFISGIAIFILLLRVTKTVISIGGFAAMAILIAVEVYFILTILNSIRKDSSVDNTRYITTKIYLKKLDILIVLLIVALVFTFMKELKAYSIGMTLFYGMISLAIANFAFMRTLLIENHK